MLNVKELTRLKDTGIRFCDQPPMLVSHLAETCDRPQKMGGTIHQLVLSVGANQRVMHNPLDHGAPSLGYIENELQRHVHYYMYGEIERALSPILNKLLSIHDVEGDLRQVIDDLRDLHRKVSF